MEGLGPEKDTKTIESLTALGELLWRREEACLSILHVFSQDLCAFPLQVTFYPTLIQLMSKGPREDGVERLLWSIKIMMT